MWNIYKFPHNIGIEEKQAKLNVLLKFAQLVNDKFRSKPGLLSFGPYLSSVYKYHETSYSKAEKKHCKEARNDIEQINIYLV